MCTVCICIDEWPDYGSQLVFEFATLTLNNNNSSFTITTTTANATNTDSSLMYNSVNSDNTTDTARNMLRSAHRSHSHSNSNKMKARKKSGLFGHLFPSTPSTIDTSESPSSTPTDPFTLLSSRGVESMVRIVYNDRIMRVPGCVGEWCSLPHIVSLLDKYSISHDDYIEQCKQ